MGNILFSNVRIFDGTGEHPYLGEVVVQGNRIKHVGRGSRTVAPNGHTVIDGAGATPARRRVLANRVRAIAPGGAARR